MAIPPNPFKDRPKGDIDFSNLTDEQRDWLRKTKPSGNEFRPGGGMFGPGGPGGYFQRQEKIGKEKIANARHFKDDENYTSEVGDIISLSNKRDISDHPEWTKIGTVGEKTYYQDIGKQNSGKYSWMVPVITITGALIGSIIPVLGTTLGAAVGAAVGAGLGAGAQASAEGEGVTKAAEEGVRGLAKGTLMAGAGLLTGGASLAMQGAAIAGASAVGTAIDVKTRGGGEMRDALEEGARAGIMTRANMLGPEFGAVISGLDAKTRPGGSWADAITAATVAEAQSRGVSLGADVLQGKDIGSSQPGLFGTTSGKSVSQDLLGIKPEFSGNPMGSTITPKLKFGSDKFDSLPQYAGTGGNTVTGSSLDASTYDPNAASSLTYRPGGDTYMNTGFGTLGGQGDINTPLSFYKPDRPFGGYEGLRGASSKTDIWGKLGAVGAVTGGIGSVLSAGSSFYKTYVDKQLSEDQLQAYKDAQEKAYQVELAKIEEEKRRTEMLRENNENNYKLGTRQDDYLRTRNRPTATGSPGVTSF